MTSILVLRARNFLLHFWNLHQVLNNVKKADQVHSSTISDIIDSERSSYLNALKVMF